jgi:hypothetical protein
MLNILTPSSDFVTIVAYSGSLDHTAHAPPETHNILEPTTGVTFFNSGFKSDPTELFPSIVLVIAGEKRFPPPNFNLKIVRI